MYKLVPITTALLLALAAPTAVLADPGNGKGGDKKEHGQRGGDQARGHGGGGEARGHGNGNDGGNDRGEARRAERPDMRSDMRPDIRMADVVRGSRNDDRNEDRRDDRRDIRRAVEREVFQTRDGQPVVYFRRDDDRGLIAGCPPGLAKKNTGCLPPGSGPPDRPRRRGRPL